jgi:hypothetical protein
MRRFWAVGMAVLAGCVGPVTSDEAAKLTEERACVLYGEAIRRADLQQAPVLREELARRNIHMGSAEDELIGAKRLRVGTSRCLMWAAWGSSTRDNRTTTAYGTRIQHVFGSSGTRNYVYTENGRITAIQN